LEKKEKYISEQEYTFLSIDGDFYTKNELLMLDVMKHELTLLKRDDYCREMLEELIVSESLKLKKLNFNQANFIFVKLYSTTRLKSNKEKAKRIILQHLRKGNYKTDYKKNYYSDDISNTTDLGRVYKTFNSTLHKLSKRYNNLDLQNLSIHNIPQLSSV